MKVPMIHGFTEDFGAAFFSRFCGCGASGGMRFPGDDSNQAYRRGGLNLATVCDLLFVLPCPRLDSSRDTRRLHNANVRLAVRCLRLSLLLRRNLPHRRRVLRGGLPEPQHDDSLVPSALGLLKRTAIPDR